MYLRLAQGHMDPSHSDERRVTECDQSGARARRPRNGLTSGSVPVCSGPTRRCRTRTTTRPGLLDERADA